MSASEIAVLINTTDLTIEATDALDPIDATGLTPKRLGFAGSGSESAD